LSKAQNATLAAMALKLAPLGAECKDINPYM
jgi:hypothetical protein